MVVLLVLVTVYVRAQDHRAKMDPPVTSHSGLQYYERR